MKENCWEYKECGFEQGGRNTGTLGVCPAAREERLNGVHGGKNAGRACWAVAGTLCDGEVQGTFALKYRLCGECGFFRYVVRGEKDGYKRSGELLGMLKAGVQRV